MLSCISFWCDQKLNTTFKIKANAASRWKQIQLGWRFKCFGRSMPSIGVHIIPPTLKSIESPHCMPRHDGNKGKSNQANIKGHYYRRSMAIKPHNNTIYLL